MRRLFWALLGIGIGVVVGVQVVKAVQRTKEKYSPAGMARRAGEAGGDLAERLRDAVEEGRRVMEERERELRAELGLDAT